MSKFNVPLADHLSTQSKVGEEISLTGKWVSCCESNYFRKSSEYKEMLKEWDDIHQEAKHHHGMLSTEIDPAIGQEAVLIHHIFQDSKSLVDYFKTISKKHVDKLKEFARPDYQLIRGIKINDEIREVISSKASNSNYGEYLFGFVKHNYSRPNPENAVQVTAKWTCKDEGSLEELKYWWQMVGTDAYDLEEGMVRFEVYQVIGENALIIHETFDTSDELKFHLTKGTADKYKKEIDKIAYPENYFFRGPVSWMIRTYSKFMHLPATYTGRGSCYVIPEGTMSEGLISTN